MIKFYGQNSKLEVAFLTNKVVLACATCGSRNYSTMSNKESERLELKKFCRTCSAHTIHRQTK
jgi:large subunit ribosomal protein L33